VNGNKVSREEFIIGNSDYLLIERETVTELLTVNTAVAIQVALVGRLKEVNKVTSVRIA
jgi:hypothetical protein